MNRPLRLQFPGALYHVTSRGDRKAAIFLDHIDRLTWLSILGDICRDYNFVVYSFCQMTNHYHLLVETVDGNLQLGMQQLNGRYSQYFNRRHELVGHVFQGRYKAILVQREKYLLELTRYIVLNPVRAQLVELPEHWRWSSHQHFIGTKPAPPWLDHAAILSNFAAEPAEAISAYCRFVAAGAGMPSPLLNIRHQLILGDEAFAAQPLASHQPAQPPRATPKIQRRAMALALDEYQRQYPARDEAIVHAHLSNAYTMEQIAAHFNLSAKTVSRIVKKHRMR